MQRKNNQKSPLLSALILLSITPLTACAAGKYHNPTNPPKNEASITIEFNPEGGVSLVDRNGKPLTPCVAACTAETEKKYGKRCPEVNPKLPVCKGLSNASVADVTNLIIIESEKNPYCYTSYFNGNYQEICYGP